MIHVTRHTTHVEAVELEVAALRARSAAVFGNRYFAEVVAAIVEAAPTPGSLITVRMLAARAGLSDNLVRPVVKRLVEASLLDPHLRERPRGASYHEVRRADGLWDALVKVCELLSEREDHG